MTFILQEINTDNIDKILGSNLKCSHLVLNCTGNLQNYEDIFIKLFTFKLNNRHIKTLLYIPYKNLYDLKDVIFKMTYYGFDGLNIQLSTSIPDLKPLNKLITLLSKLPEPYNTKWDLFLTVKDDYIKDDVLKIDYIDGYITNNISMDSSKILFIQQQNDIYYSCIITCIDKNLLGVYLPYEVDYRYFLPLEFMKNDKLLNINRINFPSSYFISKLLSVKK